MDASASASSPLPSLVAASAAPTVEDGYVEIPRGLVTKFRRDDLKSGTVAEEFVLFPSLAQEIQDGVWEIAIRESSSYGAQVFLALEKNENVDDRGCDVSPGPGFIVTGPLLPNFLLDVQRKHMIDLAIKMGLYSKLEIAGHGAIFYRPHIDRIHLDLARMVTGRRLLNLVGQEAVARIRHVDLNLISMRELHYMNVHGLDTNLRSMTSLETLRIVGTSLIKRGRRAPRLFQMKFERRPNNLSKTYIPVLFHAGVELEGNDFWTEIHRQIDSRYEIDRYRHIGNFLEELVSLRCNLPAFVKVEATYEVEAASNNIR